MYETLLRAAEETGRTFPVLPGVQGQGRGTEDVPLGFDDGTVFSREEIGRTLLIPGGCFPKPTDSDELPLSATRRATCFGARHSAVTASARIFRYAEDLLFIVACMKGRGTAPSRWTGRITTIAFTAAA